MLIGDLLARQAHSDQPALFVGEETVSYRALHERSGKVATDLARAETTGPVGLLLPNGVSYAAGYFGAALGGRTVVPLHVQASDRELTQTLQLCDVNTVVTDDTGARRLAALAAGGAPGPSRCVTVGGPTLTLRHAPVRTAHPDARDVAALLATSGTTGGVKRVMLTHRNLLANITSNIQSLNLTARDRTLITLPMTFGYCHTAQFLTHVALGASMVIHQGTFLPAEVLAAAQRHAVTNATMVPSMLLLLLRYPPRAMPDLSALRLLCFGGAPIAVEALTRLMALLPGVGLVQTYGQTEAAPRLTALLPQDATRKIGSVGRPIPQVRVRVVDELGADRPAGAVGDVIAAGPNVMKGYYRAPEQTREVLRGGWLHTGDLGYTDGEGFLYLVGRRRNIIIRGGVNVAPEEIEAALLTHPGVADVRVQGVPHPLWGEAIRAEVVARTGEPAAAEALLHHCAHSLASHQLPDELVFVSALPKTTTGKVQRSPPDAPLRSAFTPPTPQETV